MGRAERGERERERERERANAHSKYNAVECQVNGDGHRLFQCFFFFGCSIFAILLKGKGGDEFGAR